MNGILADIPKHCSDNLFRILNQTGAVLVISSSWRHHWEDCRDLLQSVEDEQGNNLWQYVIGKTGYGTGGGRSTEILNWINDYHQTCKEGYHITHFVAIDDEQFDMKALKRCEKLIKTDMSVGISTNDADMAIVILNKK